MENKSFKALYEECISLINDRKYKEAFSRLKGYEESRDILLYRLYYMLFSRKDSPVYSPQKAALRLDGLCSFGDEWAMGEKGRCLLHGLLYDEDSLLAEDLLVKAGLAQPLAIFYRAEIHFLGIHKDNDGNSVYDFVEAEMLYNKIINSHTKNPYIDKAKIQICRLLMKKGGLTDEQSKLVYSYLIELKNKGFPSAVSAYSEFLLTSLEDAMSSVFDKSEIPSDHEGKINMETRRRECRRSIQNIKTALSGEL